MNADPTRELGVTSSCGLLGRDVLVTSLLARLCVPVSTAQQPVGMSRRAPSAPELAVPPSARPVVLEVELEECPFLLRSGPAQRDERQPRNHERKAGICDGSCLGGVSREGQSTRRFSWSSAGALNDGSPGGLSTPAPPFRLCWAPPARLKQGSGV